MKKTFAAITLTLSFVTFSLAQTPPSSSSKTDNATPQAGTPQVGVEVTLEQESGAFVKTIRTDAEGKFTFSGLRPGSYRLKADATVHTPRDPATGQASGKRVQAPSATAEVKSPRDVATGQASGKRTPTAEQENNEGDASAAANRTINTSRSNIKNQRVSAEIIMGDDDEPPTTKAGVSTSRSNIRTKQSLNVPADTDEVLAVQLLAEETANTKRAFVLPHVLEKSGLLMQVGANGQLMGRLLKTRHDTVKNAIGNIR